MPDALINVLTKEWKDASRDHRSIMASLAFAVFGPVFLYLTLNSMNDTTTADAPVAAAIVGLGQAPALATYLREQQVLLSEFDHREQALAALGPALPVMIHVPEDYARNYAARMPIEIAVTADFKREEAQLAARRVAGVVNDFGQRISRARLIAAGVSPHRTRAITAQTYDLSIAGGHAARISSALIYVFLIAGFVSGAFMAADAVAGERERHSLEPLLAQPVAPIVLVVGKWIAAGAISVGVSTITVVFGAWLLQRAPLEALGLRLHLEPAIVITGALALAPLAMMAVALQMLLAARAKTYREAGTYAQFTIFLPIAVAGAMMLGNVDFGAIGAMAPITGQTQTLQDLFLEGRAGHLNLLLSAASTLALALAMVWLTAQRLADEASL